MNAYLAFKVKVTSHCGLWFQKKVQNRNGTSFCSHFKEKDFHLVTRNTMVRGPEVFVSIIGLALNAKALTSIINAN